MLRILIVNLFRTNSITLRKHIQPLGTRNMSKKALVLLAPGAEEMEFVVAADVLVRGGIEVTVAGVPDNNLVKCSRGINIQPDISVEEACQCANFDAVVLPGGLGGTEALAKSKMVGNILKDLEKKQKIIAAICAAPLALKAHGIGCGKNITSYPSVKGDLEGTYNYQEKNVVVDGNYVTSRGPGTAYEFGLTLVELLAGKEKACEVAKGILVNY